MPCSGLDKLSPDPFMMLMMHYSVSFTSLASPKHFLDAFLTLLLNALPHQAQGSTSQKWPLRDHPQHPLYSLRSPLKLKPCLSAGFRDIYIYIYNNIQIYNIYIYTQSSRIPHGQHTLAQCPADEVEVARQPRLAALPLSRMTSHVQHPKKNQQPIGRPRREI